VLKDVQAGKLQRHYDGGHVPVEDFVPARQDLLPEGYAFGTIQTTRGCPLNCSFCSVTTFNGAQYRQRPVDDVVREFATIPEKRILVVDDNLIGTRPDHIARAKDLFRALAKAKLRKQWIAQATINFSDDDELMALAWKAGCRGVFVGFESPTADGLRELGKKFNLRAAATFAPRFAASSATTFWSWDRSSSGWTSTMRASACASPKRQTVRRRQHERPVPDAASGDAPVGSDEERRPHHPR
jgi:radical SAM superfamily enzyme YgiQ (UPF0313 family)